MKRSDSAGIPERRSGSIKEYTNSIVQARQEIANCENRIHLFASKAEECQKKINKILEKLEEMEKNSGNTAERPIRNIVLD